MVEKGQVWNIRKNKMAIVYYFLMIIFAIFGILIMWGLITTDEILYWWQENVTFPLPGMMNYNG